MKNLLVLVFTLFTFTTLSAQEEGTDQADSIYKSNRVKLRKWYIGTDKRLGAINYYDREGRLSSHQLRSNLGATEKITHFDYDANGRLVNIVDSIKHGEPHKKEIKRMEKMGLHPDVVLGHVRKKPSIEVHRYELVYENDEMVKVIRYDPAGKLEYIDNLKNNGLIQEREFYRDGELYQVNTTEYLIPKYEEKYYGWEIIGDSKSEWNYTFEYKIENGVVQSYTRFDNGDKKETVDYFYADNGLLLKTQGYTLEQFEYEYYK